MGKLFPTFATLVWFFTCVNSLMINKGFLSSKGFPTLLTQKSFLLSGGLEGLAAAGGLPEVFPIFALLVQLFLLVHSHMTSKV